MVVDGGGGEGFVDLSSPQRTLPRCVRISPTLELQIYAGSFGEVGDRFGEVEGLEVHDELDGVPAHLAPVAVVETLFRVDAEGRGLLLVVGVGAEACEAGPLALEGRELGGDLDDVGGLPDLLYAALRDPQVRSPVVPMYEYLRCAVVWSRGNVTLPGVDTGGRSTTVPRAGYADLPPGIGFEPKDEPLRRDINLLGRVLGRILIEQEGESFFETEEEIRLLCKRLRFDYAPELDERLRRRIDAMSVGELRRIVRAFSVYFQLVNIAERYHRVRRRRQYEASAGNPPQRASLASALGRLKREGLGTDALQDVLDGMEVGLVLTAHPTEAMRRSVRRKHVRIAEMLETMESQALTWKERRRREEDLAEEITVLWQTDELRVRRPEVAQEIERTLLYFENPLISATLEAYREFEDELSRQYAEDAPTLGRVLEFGSWVGGDQDGNPFVEPEMITVALGLHREVILGRHLASVVSLEEHMSQSAKMISVSDGLRRSVEKDERLMPEMVERYTGVDPNETYRRKLRFGAERLRRTLASRDHPSLTPARRNSWATCLPSARAC